MNAEKQKAFQFLSNVVVAYGQTLDKVAQEPFFIYANQQMQELAKALDDQKPEEET
jgi:hypothetical protein